MQAWYARPSVDGEVAPCEFYASLFIADAVTLGPRIGKMHVDADCYQITIGDGGSLVVDNPNLELSGTYRMLQVHHGGSVTLAQGRITTEDSKNGSQD